MNKKKQKFGKTDFDKLEIYDLKKEMEHLIDYFVELIDYEETRLHLGILLLIWSKKSEIESKTLMIRKREILKNEVKNK